MLRTHGPGGRHFMFRMGPGGPGDRMGPPPDDLMDRFDYPPFGREFLAIRRWPTSSLPRLTPIWASTSAPRTGSW